jgi:acyl homoserine lactone synthase
MAVDIFNWETAHLFGDALPSQHRLRRKLFIDRQNYAVPVYNELEYDQYDTPAATYVVRRDPHGVVRAVNRLIPSTMPYMIRDLWPDLLSACPMPDSWEIWESSRFGVDNDLDPATRERYLSELLCGIVEFGLRRNVSWFLALLTAPLVRRSLIAAGLDVEVLGPARAIGGCPPALPIRVNVTEASVAELRRRKGLAGPVLNETGLAEMMRLGESRAA